MIGMIFRTLIVLALLAASGAAQQTPPVEKQKPPYSVTVNLPGTNEPGTDLQALVKETELIDLRSHKMGVFWWVPMEFWTAALKNQGYNSEQANRVFAPFRNYNVFIVAAGDIGIGSISWIKEEEIKKSVLLHDSQGNVYKPLQDVPGEISSFIDVMKPMLKSMMGNFGEGLQFIIFPAKDSGGTIFADPHMSGDLSLEVTGLMGTPTSIYKWRLPLSSLSPSKYCPVGKERVEANWRFCPWHGVKLNDDAKPASAPASAAPKP